MKFHFKTDQGIRKLTSEEAARRGGEDPAYLHKDLCQAVERGDLPSWTVKVQVMPEADADAYRFNPFDITKVWPYADYPLITIGKLVLDQLPENYFEETEQSAFDPSNFVPGIGPSPDPMLQARLFAYGDAHRYRLGINHTRLPVNEPKAVRDGAKNYGRNGAMRFDDNGGRKKNYEPNSFGGPAPDRGASSLGFTLSGRTGPHTLPRHAEDNDYVQAGALYPVMKEDERARLIDNIAGSLARVSKVEIIERALGHFEKADPEYGRRLRAAVMNRREARASS